MTSPPATRPTHQRHRTVPRGLARLLAGALGVCALLVVVCLAIAAGLTQPALASEDEPLQALTAPTPPGPQSFRTYLPLTLVAPGAEQEAVDLVAFTYRLQQDDDLTVLALEWGIDSEAIACVTRSGQEPLSGLRPGQVIMIPNPRYRCHTVQPGETVAQIAQSYEVTVDVLLAEPWNAVKSAGETLEAGRRLLILDGVRPDLAGLRQSQGVSETVAAGLPAAGLAAATPTPEQPAAQLSATSSQGYGDGQFIWPVRGGVISQGYRVGHRAIDIAAPIGTPVYAADNGIVLKSGYSKDGYGGRVIIDHQIDYVTLYAHLSQALVQEGDVVQKGQLIGYVGSTGNSTGPHIHFELRDFGFLIDPRPLLAE